MNEGDDDISVDENEDPAVLASPEALETSSFVEKPSLEDLIDDTEETALGSDNTNKKNLELQHSYTTAVDLFSIIISVRTKLQE
ncbi:unnamed protein product [Rotaria sp. Silwood1]|nr:unnamed protein product [Rotaria sp. Silwood1]